MTTYEEALALIDKATPRKVATAAERKPTEPAKAR